MSYVRYTAEYLPQGPKTLVLTAAQPATATMPRTVAKVLTA